MLHQHKISCFLLNEWEFCIDIIPFSFSPKEVETFYYYFLNFETKVASTTQRIFILIYLRADDWPKAPLSPSNGHIFLHEDKTTIKVRKGTNTLLPSNPQTPVSFINYSRNVFCSKKSQFEIMHCFQLLCLFSFLQPELTPRSLFDFHDIDTTEDYRPDILQSVLRLVCWELLLVLHLWQEYHWSETVSCCIPPGCEFFDLSLYQWGSLWSLN